MARSSRTPRNPRHPRPARSERDRARRELSQNFLSNRSVADRIARAVRGPQSGGPVGLLLEVGAGKGMLTEALAPHCRELLAHEVDPHLIPGLRARFGGPGPYAHVRIVGGDFLAARPPSGPFAIAGNLPFSRTAAIVDWCLRAPGMTSATFVTQLEYARKRTGDYGRWSLLTVRTWPIVEWRLLGRVRREEFRPVPRVDAGILRIERRPRPLLPQEALADYEQLVELGFSGVGGSLYASLRRAYGARRLDAAFRAARLDRATVVAHATPGQWLTLAATLIERAPGSGSTSTAEPGHKPGTAIDSGRRADRYSRSKVVRAESCTSGDGIPNVE